MYKIVASTKQLFPRNRKEIKQFEGVCRYPAEIQTVEVDNPIDWLNSHEGFSIVSVTAEDGCDYLSHFSSAHEILLNHKSDVISAIHDALDKFPPDGDYGYCHLYLGLDFDGGKVEWYWDKYEADLFGLSDFGIQLSECDKPEYAYSAILNHLYETWLEASLVAEDLEQI